MDLAVNKTTLAANDFDAKVRAAGVELAKSGLDILQVNLGKLCNLACVHCHVEAGPTKTKENMDLRTAEAVVRLMDYKDIHTVDLTGGAPEMNPHFRMLVREARKRGHKVIDRCNLTVIFEPGQDDLPEFLARNKVQVVASLPCYSRENVDKQRGKGTFGQSIDALVQFNELGYGRPDTGLELDLVYNPVGPHLPPPQAGLEADYKTRLKEDFGIVFNKLFTITNMPITRYAKYLKAFKQYDAYAELLTHHFNPHTLDGLMCRNTLSVGWDGKIYDCDFNQMLGMQIRNGRPMTVFNMDPHEFTRFKIKTANHCFGCTAGSGSSCQGALKN